MSIEDLEKIFDKVIEEATSRASMDELAQQIARMVNVRTRVGRGVSSDGAPSEPLASLSPQYIDMRKTLKKIGKLSGATSPSKSNLTKSGQMLDAIRGKSDKAQEIEIYFEEARDDGLTNSEVANRVSKYRPFFALSEAEIKQIEGWIGEKVNRAFEKHKEGL